MLTPALDIPPTACVPTMPAAGASSPAPHLCGCLNTPVRQALLQRLFRGWGSEQALRDEAQQQPRLFHGLCGCGPLKRRMRNAVAQGLERLWLRLLHPWAAYTNQRGAWNLANIIHHYAGYLRGHYAGPTERSYWVWR